MKTPSTTNRAPAAAAKFICQSFLADGVRVETFATKKAAKDHGTNLRRAGVDAFVFSAADFARVSK